MKFPKRLQKARVLASFLLRAVVVGLAAAFLVVWWKPALLGAVSAPEAQPAGAQPASAQPNATQPNANQPDATQPASAAPAHPGAAMQSFADSVARAAPAVVNIYTARVVTERRQAAPLDQLFGDYWPSYRRRVERSLG